MREVKSFTIDRKKWLHGEDDSALIRTSDGKMCCLGIYLSACKVPKKKLENVQTPYGVEDTVPYWTKEMTIYQYNDIIVIDLMQNNDSRYLPDDTREDLIKGGFKKAGINVRFKGSY